MAADGSRPMTRERVARTLEMVLAVWEPVFPYRLVGTAAALLQGVALRVADEEGSPRAC